MTDQDLQDLLSKYPLLLKGVNHIDCESGWYNIINLFCGITGWYIETLPEELQPDVYAVRIKEKLGTLRIYFNQMTPFIGGAITMAEAMSSTTCEVCGQIGEIRSNAHIQTLCSKHYKRSLK